MKITETTFNKILFFIIIPFFIIGSIFINKSLLFFGIILFLYHIYSSYKFSIWPFNSPDNPDSISSERNHPRWTEYLCVICAIILFKIGLDGYMINKWTMSNILIIIISSIFGIAHLRQIIIPDKNYYRWMYEYI